MTKRKLIRLAKSIIQDNQYLILATVNNKGKPWASPVYYCCDTAYNFFYASQMKSVHSKNIFKNPHIACAIFNSEAPEGTGKGVQIAGKVQLVKDKELVKAFRYYRSRFVTEIMVRKGPYKLFKLIPTNVFVTDPDAKVDKRVEVTLQ